VRSATALFALRLVPGAFVVATVAEAQLRPSEAGGYSADCGVGRGGHYFKTRPVPSTRLIGGGKTSADQAALYNSRLVRYVDLLDSYMSPGGLCHPSDNFGAVLAAAGQAEATGEELMLALAVAHQFEAGGGSFAISFSAIGSTKTCTKRRERKSCRNMVDE